MTDTNKRDIACIKGAYIRTIPSHEMLVKYAPAPTITAVRTPSESSNTRPYENSIPRTTTYGKGSRTRKHTKFEMN